ncbi:hypothetical protein [Photobacterium leiognathi]|uniref:hypothetical protein n=1 Tax=Photobacterium leiognathi TaxID=553611 RepID=UPI0027386071|nr:hypothetical protein [Photobacterium leiognathi]
MDRKDSLERKFMSRLEKTIAVFGYISLETIVDGQLKQKTNFNLLNLKKVYKIADIQRKSSSIPENFKKYNRKNSKNRRHLIE